MHALKILNCDNSSRKAIAFKMSKITSILYAIKHLLFLVSTKNLTAVFQIPAD